MSVSKSLLAALFPECSHLDAYLPHLAAAMDEHGITTAARQAAFLAQIGHESEGLTRFVENLNYSADALRRTWPKHFPNDKVAALYARRPEAIGNRAYANRMGNGPEGSGDGYRYRGRGAIQITGRQNYRIFGKLLGLDLEALPDQAAEPAVMFHLAAAFWREGHCNELADAGDFAGITRRINGGLNGQPERAALYARAKQLMDQDATA